MIRSFNHRGLKALWEKGDGSKLDRRMVNRITRRLDALDAVIRPQDMDQPGFDFHALTGKRRGTYTVHVNGPWCVTFRWDGTGATHVDLEQYH